jgi:hypothetical protein
MPIKYDNFVKRPQEEHPYSPEEILELQKCSEDVIHFIQYVKIVNPDLGEITFQPRDYQLDLLEKFQRNRFNIGLCSRQSGKTTVVGAYVLWYAIFHENKNIGIVSNKEKSAKMILDRIRKSYELLPYWLKPGVTEYSKTFITFDNGSKINISATSEDAFRGETMNLLVCDEFAFVPGGQAEAFWAANYPTISASTEAKIIIISTPNGLFNIFHRIWTDATIGKNTFVTTKVSWQRVPLSDGTFRDAKWEKEQRQNLGDRKFAQEFAVEFIGSTNTLIEPGTLEIILKGDKLPIKLEDKDTLGGRLRVWERPVEGASYVIGADPAKGTGENFSAGQVCRIDSITPVKMEQVAVFHHNLTDVYSFADILVRMAKYYNHAYLMVENNGEGSAVVNRIWWDHEYENLVNSGSKTANLGIRSTGGGKKGTKPKAALLMKKLIEDGSLGIVDRRTLKELGSFIEENGRFFGKDTHDDLVSALFWACYFLEMKILEDSYKFEKDDINEDAWGILSDVNEMFDDWSWLDGSNAMSD